MGLQGGKHVLEKLLNLHMDLLQIEPPMNYNYNEMSFTKLDFSVSNYFQLKVFPQLVNKLLLNQVP